MFINAQFIFSCLSRLLSKGYQAVVRSHELVILSNYLMAISSTSGSIMLV